MRLVKKTQLHFGEVNIADIDLSARSRDDIPALLKGLQYLYTYENNKRANNTRVKESLSLSPALSCDVCGEDLRGKRQQIPVS